MKRMVLIPEEILLRYEERDKQRIENTYNDSPEGVMYGGGEDYEEILENSKRDRQRAINTYYDPPVGIYYEPPKGIMYGGGEDTLSSEMIIRAIEIDLRTPVFSYSSIPPVGTSRDFVSLCGKQCDQMCSYIYIKILKITSVYVRFVARFTKFGS